MENKEDFVKKVLEEKIFEELKDDYFGGIKDIKNRYKDYPIDHDEVYRRIINYRIKRYGTSFISKPANDYHISSEEYARRSERRRQAKYVRRKLNERKGL